MVTAGIYLPHKGASSWQPDNGTFLLWKRHQRVESGSLLTARKGVVRITDIWRQSQNELFGLMIDTTYYNSNRIFFPVKKTVDPWTTVIGKTASRYYRHLEWKTLGE